MNAIDTLTEAIKNVETTGDEAAAIEAINEAKRDTLRGVHRRLVGSLDVKRMKVAELREGLEQEAAMYYNAWEEAQTEPEVKPEPKPKGRRGSKYTAILQHIMDTYGKNGVAVISESVMVELGFTKSSIVYHQYWDVTFPPGKAAHDMGIAATLRRRKGEEVTLTLMKVA